MLVSYLFSFHKSGNLQICCVVVSSSTLFCIAYILFCMASLLVRDVTTKGMSGLGLVLMQDVYSSWKYWKSTGIWHLPGNIGNLLKFNWSSWKIAKCWQQSWDSCSPSNLVACHSDERWSELIITSSVRDSSYIACRRYIINQAVTTWKPTESFLKCLLEVYWKFV